MEFKKVRTAVPKKINKEKKKETAVPSLANCNSKAVLLFFLAVWRLRTAS
jgi:hypothetical protein